MWMGLERLHFLEKDPVFYPQFSEEHAYAIMRELEYIAADIFINNKKIDALLLRKKSNINHQLAEIYDLEPPSEETQFDVASHRPGCMAVA